MKKLLFYLSLGILFSFLPSCNYVEDFLNNDDDGYSMNNSWIGYGLVQKDTAANSFTILLDNGDILHPDGHTNWYDYVSNNQRVIVNYTLKDNVDAQNADQYNVRINSIRNVLYKGILQMTPAMEDSIGNDPIHVKDQWIRNNMLNFELQYRGGNATHFINLVRKPDTIANQAVVLELRHNANNDSDMIRLSAVVTFDLSSLKVEGRDSVAFRVVSKDYNGVDYGYNGVYKY